MELRMAELLIHPVRLRIALTAAGERLTASQIAERLADVPQASLYRHLRMLSHAGILTVVEENPVRGAVEKVYTLNESASKLSKEDLDRASRDDHMRYFTTFLSTLAAQFRGYLQLDRVEPGVDGLTYRTAPLHLTDAEYADLICEIGASIEKRRRTPRGPGRRRRLVSVVGFPDEPGEAHGGEHSSGT